MPDYTNDHINATKKQTSEGSVSVFCSTERQCVVSAWGGECMGFGSEYSSDVTGDGPEDEGQQYGAYGGYDDHCPSDDDGDESAANFANSMEPDEDTGEEFDWDGEYVEEDLGEADCDATCGEPESE
jgi:hypothetical protein